MVGLCFITGVDLYVIHIAAVIGEFGSRSAGSTVAVEEIIADVNMDISHMGFELKKIQHFDGTVYIGFVNKEADEASKSATAYKTKDGKPNAIVTSYFRTLLDKIADCQEPVDDVGFISSQDAYYIPISVRSSEVDEGEGGSASQQAGHLNMSDRQKALDQFVKDGWLSMHPSDETLYTFGPRAVLELGPWLLKEFQMAEESERVMRRALGL